MGTPLALVWDLIAHDNASAGFHKVGAAARATAAETETMGTKFAKAGTLIGVAAIGVAAASAKMAISFEDSTEKIVTGAGESEKAIGEVRKGILKMAGSVGTMPEELSKGMYLIESAGFRGAKGLDVLKAAAEGAKVGGADMATVADGLTTALTDYHLPTSRAAEITSKLVATVGAGKTTMDALSGSMAKVLPFSSNLGISFKETMGAMATMTGEGIDAASAATMLKFTMMSLSNETPKGAKALEDVGLSAQKVTSSLGDKGLNATLSMVIDAIGKKFPKGSADYNKALASVVGGTRGMGATLAITGSHAKTFADNVKTIGGSSADAEGHVKNFAETSKDIAFQMDQAKAAVSAFAIELGNELLPKITTTIKFFTEHKTVTKDLGIAVLALGGFLVTYSVATKVAAAATGTFALAQRLLGTSVATTAAATEAATVAQGELDVAMNANPIGAVVLAVGALALAYHHFAGNSNALRDSEKKFAGTLGDVTSQLDAQTGAMTKAARATISKHLADSGAYTSAAKMGISLRDVLAAATGNTAAIERVNAAEKAYADTLSGKSFDAKKKGAKALGTLTTAIGGTNKALRDNLTKLAQTDTAMGKLGKRHIKPTVDVVGLDGALAKVHNLLGLLSGLGDSTITTKPVPGMFQPKKATGGLLTGPGTGTSDSIPLWGSNGEYMIKASSVAKYGTHMFDAINAGRFADGGLIGGTSGGVSASTKALRALIEKNQKALDANTTKLGTLKDQLKSFDDTVRDKFRTDGFNQGDPNTGASGLAALGSTLTLDAAHATAFGADLKRLKAKGISDGLYNALAASGDLQTADELAAQGRGGINVYDKLYLDRQRATTALGVQAGAQSSLGVQVAAQTKVIDKLEKTLHTLRSEVRAGAREGTKDGIHGAASSGQHASANRPR